MLEEDGLWVNNTRMIMPICWRWKWSANFNCCRPPGVNGVGFLPFAPLRIDIFCCNKPYGGSGLQFWEYSVFLTPSCHSGRAAMRDAAGCQPESLPGGSSQRQQKNGTTTGRASCRAGEPRRWAVSQADLSAFDKPPNRTSRSLKSYLEVLHGHRMPAGRRRSEKRWMWPIVMLGEVGLGEAHSAVSCSTVIVPGETLNQRREWGRKGAAILHL